MSAAAPAPHRASDGLMSNGIASAQPSSAPKGNLTEPIYGHISELMRKAQGQYDRNSSISKLLETAETSLNQAQMMLDFRRPDKAFIEYLRASEIVVKDIPTSKDWVHIQYDQAQSGRMQKYRVLQKRIHSENDRYDKIKDIILNNNKRYNVQPDGVAGSNGHTATTSVQQTQSHQTPDDGHGAVQRIRPTPSPKPESLHGRAISSVSPGPGSGSVSTGQDALHERFAKLRTFDKAASERNPRASMSSEHRHSIASSSSAKPQGPRDLTYGKRNGLLITGKLFLDTEENVNMPKAPSPTYSPARNMQTTGNIAPPRHSARSMVSSRELHSAVASSASLSYASNEIETDKPQELSPVSESTVAFSISRQLPKRTSVNVPKEMMISSRKLYDYLERFNVLLIDFRPRKQFDEGHVYVRSIICIEPLFVTEGMSAEELADRMVLSPEIEQEIFAQRDKFDLVVYYDAQTQSKDYLSRPVGEAQLKLKYLHETLGHFNLDKPLQRPPIILMGGLKAWIELIGNHALQTSDTAVKVKHGRPLQRRPALNATGSSQLRPPKRRLRDYNPLDDEEEQKWRARARAESVTLQAPTKMIDEEQSGSAIEEFLERFPDAGSLERQAFGPLQPSRTLPAPPELPAKIPAYPPAPPASQYPSIPTRPQPAAPRMSYTGVSDPLTAQSTPPARSLSMTPYMSSKILGMNRPLPKTGLHNFNATCYMNAMIQALSATKPLSAFVLDDGFRSHIQRDNWKGTKGVMPELYSNLIRSLWKGDVNYIKPTTFRDFLNRLRRDWTVDQQQDSKEFFDLVVDFLHEDMNCMWSRAPPKELTEKEEAHREGMPKHLVARIEWSRFTDRNQSFVTSLFTGQHLSRIRCCACGHASTTYETWNSIEVEMPPSAGRSPRVTLDECLESYCREEVLTASDRVYCKRCKQEQDTAKRLQLTRLPQFLVICFKRYKRGGNSASHSKLHTLVDFPLSNLNMEPHVLPQPSREESGYIANCFPDYLRPEVSMTPPYRYDAYAVVHHRGESLSSGHYISFAKVKDDVWRKFNDRNVSDLRIQETPSNELKNSDAYVVFYQRRHT